MVGSSDSETNSSKFRNLFAKQRLESTTITFQTSTIDADSSTETISGKLGDSRKNIAIPGYLKLDQDKDFDDLRPIGKGGTANVYVAKIINATLAKRTGLDEAAIKHITETSDQQFRLELAILG